MDRRLDALVKAGFLCLKSDGTYVRLTEGGASFPRAAKTPLKLTPFVTRRAG
jgi:hypothetical protein